MYFYKRTERQLFTVGYEDSQGHFHGDSDHGTRAEAAERVAYLNGQTAHRVDRCITQIDNLERRLIKVEQAMEGAE